MYNAKECRCVCNNSQDQDQCDKEPKTKIWNSDTCLCQCMEEIECTTGFKFDQRTCKWVILRRYIRKIAKWVSILCK